MSWSSRQLSTLVQTVEVFRLFATSKLLYKASAIPLPANHAKKFESAIYRFLWIGKLEKLKLEEVKNPKLLGGLNLPCVISKADALFLSQTCRLLINSESKQFKHIKYWLGIYMKEYIPAMGQGPHAEIISPYVLHMKSLLQVAFVLDEIQIENLHLVTANSLYLVFTSSFPPPKIVSKYNADWCKVWQGLQSPCLSPWPGISSSC